MAHLIADQTTVSNAASTSSTCLVRDVLTYRSGLASGALCEGGVVGQQPCLDFTTVCAYSAQYLVRFTYGQVIKDCLTRQ